MAKHVLAGDIGGTKTILALYEVRRKAAPALSREASFPSRRYKGLERVIEEFLGSGKETVHAAAFGIAGPVVDETVKTTNLPWVVRASSLAREIGCRRVQLMNDLEATAFGGLYLGKRNIHLLRRGKQRKANIAVIAAGTGLGQAFLYWDGKRHRPVATEGGHADFAPRNQLEVRLLVYLQKKFGRVSYERVLSGPGLVNIFRFFMDELGRPVSDEIRERLAAEDPGSVIGETAVAGTCETAVEAVDLFVSLYGAQAGNLALTVMATGGVFVGGGIAVKLFPRMTTGVFERSFLDKGRYSQFLATVPVGILLDPKTALVGAVHAAIDLLR
jgi:glucokinase